MSRVGNGTYTGSYEAIFVAGEVKVAVKDHKIARIEVVKDVGQRGAWASPVLNRVIAAQSLRVDTVSGATNGSEVILQAVENALTKNEAASSR